MVKLNKLTRRRYKWRNIITLSILFINLCLFLTRDIWIDYLPDFVFNQKKNIEKELNSDKVETYKKENIPYSEIENKKKINLSPKEPITTKKEGLPTVTEHSSKSKKAPQKSPKVKSSPNNKTKPKKIAPKTSTNKKQFTIEDCIKNNERDIALEWDAYAGMKRTPFPILAVYNQPFDRSLPIDDSKLWHYRITDLDELYHSGIIVGESYEKFRKIHRSADTHFCIYELNEIESGGNMRCIPILNPVW